MELAMGEAVGDLKGEINWEARYKNLKAMTELASEVGQTLHTDEVFKIAVEKLLKFLPDIGGIELHLFDRDKNTLFLKEHRGLSPRLVGTGTYQIGEGLAGYVAETCQPLFIDNLMDDLRIDIIQMDKDHLVSYSGVPLLSKGILQGVLGIYYSKLQIFPEDIKELLTEIGTRFGEAVRNAQTYEQAAMRARRFITISRAITVTRQLGTLDEVMRDLSKVLVQSLGFDQSWIGLIDKETGELSGKTGIGVGMSHDAVNVTYHLETHHADPVIQSVLSQSPVVFQFIDDLPESDFKSWVVSLSVQSFGYIPILSGDEALGVIGVFYNADQSFEEEDIKTLLSVAEQAAIAIENARLYEQVKHSEEHYRTLFEATGTSAAILNEDMEFVLVNNAFCALSGYSEEELTGKMSLTEFLEETDDASHPLKSPPQDWEGQFINRLDQTLEVHITTTAIPGQPQILVSMIDMTRQRELERRLYRSEELASIGELSAGIAHEIRNPLVAITTSVSLLQDEPEISQEGQQLLDVVKEEADHLAVIVDDFLRFARPKTPTFAEEDVNQLLRDVIKRHRDFCEVDLTWTETYDDSLAPIPLDRHQIQQVITNLVNNALDAMGQDGELKIETRKIKKRGRQLVSIEVQDTGSGIPEKEVSKIFQPFFSMKVKGTGMGLAICQRIIDGHDGDIRVESQEGKGTTFSILLPLNRLND